MFKVHKSILFTKSNSEYLCTVIEKPTPRSTETDLFMRDGDPLALAFILCSVYGGARAVASLANFFRAWPGLVLRQWPLLAYYIESLNTDPYNLDPEKDKEAYGEFWVGLVQFVKLWLRGYRLSHLFMMIETQRSMRNAILEMLSFSLVPPPENGTPAPLNVPAQILSAIYKLVDDDDDPLRLLLTPKCLEFKDSESLSEGSEAWKLLHANDPKGWPVGSGQ